jgi:regulator of protease activity HflC (stomatin/prohibitin superfamily)
MKYGKVLITFIIALMALFSLSGCFLMEEVRIDESAIIVEGENKSLSCVGPGIHTSWGWWDDLVHIPTKTVTFQVEDKEVMTSTNQAVGVLITIQARRSSECDELKTLITKFPTLMEDKQLVVVVSAVAREGMKNGVRGFTLDGLLDDRNGLAKSIAEQIREDTGKFGIKLENVTIENIELDPAYVKELKDKATITAQTSKELERQKLIKQTSENDILTRQQQVKINEEQLKVEKSTTAVQIEIAEREGKKITVSNEVYKLNPSAYELKKLELLKGVLGDKSTLYFVPVGTDLTMLWGAGGVTPIPTGAK